MLDTGQVIADRYELLKQLGRGGFSEVWLALDKLTDVKVAIKIYAPGMGLDDAGIYYILLTMIVGSECHI